ncbi:MAG: type II toxin-antitoxin system HicB family antitoxin [Euryarchaeota archaeon]|nr:type II toxin-antitoxin system HicB family antitoxin [Euryarchaeota archaeon]
MSRRTFPVVVSKDEDGYWVGRVPGLQGAHSQGRTKRELLENMKEAIALALEAADAGSVEHAIAVERVTVEA